MKVTSKGQIIIPRKIREQCGRTSGTEITFSVRGDEVIITKNNDNNEQVAD